MGNKKILPGLTTTPASNWREKVEEIKKFNIKEIALFPTYLKLEERKELYELFGNSPLESIPHVHLRDDIEEWEMDFFVSKYKTKAFNIHAYKMALKALDYGEYADMIYLENLAKIEGCFLDNLDKSGGICLDVSHWEDSGVIQGEPSYNDFENLLKKYNTGCSHISAIKKRPVVIKHYITGEEYTLYSYPHYMDDLKELDYIKKYIKYIPELVSIELENSFEEQLKIKKYLEEIINS